NFGTQLTLLAPSFSPAMDKFGYQPSFDGTSCANPNLAGVASLVWSANSALKGGEVKQILMDTATDLGPPGRDNNTGNGLVDADAAVRRASALARDRAVALLVRMGSPQLATVPVNSNLPPGAPTTPSVSALAHGSQLAATLSPV